MDDTSYISIISCILALSVLAIFIGSLWNRIVTKKGIGWQFIRFTVITTLIPVLAILALNNALNGEAATLIALMLGYAFGKTAKDE